MSHFDPNVWSGRASQEIFMELAASGLASMYVWSGRASQEIFMELAASGLASMYPALIGACTAPGHDGYQRTCDLISGQTSVGHSGHQCSHAPEDRSSISFESLADLGVSVALSRCRCSWVRRSERWLQRRFRLQSFGRVQERSRQREPACWQAQ